MARATRLERSQFFSRPREEVFAFFTDVANLAAVTPKYVGFKMLTPLPIPLRPGTLLDYRMGMFGVPFRWRTRIETVQPGVRFTDVQVHGPYAEWHHLHEFFDVQDGTLAVDVINYRLPLGPLGVVADALVVHRLLHKIFDYRHDRLAELLK